MSKAALVLLRAYLDQARDKGVVRVKMSERARRALQQLVKEPLAMRKPAAPKEAIPEPPPTPAVKAKAQSVTLQVQGATLEEKLAHLATMAEDDPKPRALGTLRDTMVFAVGDPTSPIVFVGEAPGAEEERQREPFVGPAGQLLTKIITNAMGLRRESVYITNICKFRPSTGQSQGNGNRAPTPEEMRACLPYVLTEISLIRPQVIVALGATAATGLGIEGSVGKLRGRFHEVHGTPVIVTYHPSYLLRQEQEGRGNEAKRQVWEDMLMAMEKLGMNITEKQRNFFKSKA